MALAVVLALISVGLIFSDAFGAPVVVGLAGFGLLLLLLGTAAVYLIFRGFVGMGREPRKTLLCLLSAAGIVFAFPPYDLFPLAFVAYVPLLFAIERVSAKRAFLWGWLVGIGLTGAGFYFIVELLLVFGDLPLPAALAAHLLFSVTHGLGVALFAFVTRYLTADRRLPIVIVVPLAYVAVEMVCREVFIFPWYLGNSTYTFTAFVQVADLFGGFGLTAIIALVNGTVYTALRALLRRRAGDAVPIPWKSAAVTAAIVGATLVYGVVRIGQVDRIVASQPTIAIGLVEADIGIFRKARPEFVRNNRLIHQALSQSLAEQGADLIVWPETALNVGYYPVSRAPTDDLDELRGTLELVRGVLPRDVTWFRPSEAELVDDARREHPGTPPLDRVGIQRGFRTPLLFGVLTARPATQDEIGGIPPRGSAPPMLRYNTAMLIDAEGRVLGSYDKNVLLAFGEYVPFSHLLYELFGLNIFELIPAAGDVTPGREVAILELPITTAEGEQIEVRIGAMICYEDILANFGLALAEMQPNLFINIINDAWFQGSTAAIHHMAFSVLRSVEHRLPLVRSTNTGISTFIDPVGRITARTEMTGAETLLVDVAVMPPPTTVYSKIGDLVGWLALLTILGFTAVRVARRNRGETTKPESRSPA
jgi:apolipoprotein N-acyltransferase